MTVAMTMLGFFGLTLVPLAITFVVGLMLPRWASYVPAAICVGFFVCIWGVATSRGGGDGDEAFLFYGGIYGAALLIAGAFGRLGRAAGDSNADA